VEIVQFNAARDPVLILYIFCERLLHYVMNYGMAVVPSRVMGPRLLYVHHYKAELDGDETRACNRCLWNADPQLYYDLRCRKSEECTCAVYRKQPLSLKAAASEIVFRLIFNIENFRLDLDTTYDQYV
jgi:hypothetical protein